MRLFGLKKKLVSQEGLLLLLVTHLSIPAYASESAETARLIREALVGLDGAYYINDELLVDRKSWVQYQTDAKSGDQTNLSKFVSKDGQRALEVSYVGDNPSDIIAWNSKPVADRPSATITNLVDNSVTAHTFIKNGQSFTINKNVCDILAQQFRAKSMTAFAENASTCNEFFKVEPVPEKLRESVSNLGAVHRANVDRLRKSLAKDAVPAPEPEERASSGSSSDWVRDFTASVLARAERPKAIPKHSRDVFSAKSFPDGSSYRAAISEVANTCSRFFPGNFQTADAPPAARPAKAEGAAK